MSRSDDKRAGSSATATDRVLKAIVHEVIVYEVAVGDAVDDMYLTQAAEEGASRLVPVLDEAIGMTENPLASRCTRDAQIDAWREVVEVVWVNPTDGKVLDA